MRLVRVKPPPLMLPRFTVANSHGAIVTTVATPLQGTRSMMFGPLHFQRVAGANVADTPPMLLRRHGAPATPLPVCIIREAIAVAPTAAQKI